MLSTKLHFTPSVGVAPGTTTMSLGHARGCPPDERWMYTSPPDVDTGFPSGMGPGVTADVGPAPAPGPIDISQTSSTAPMNPADAGYHASAFPPPQQPHGGHLVPAHRWNVYATESRLRGLGDMPRLGLVVFAGVATFLAVLGIGYVASRRHA